MRVLMVDDHMLVLQGVQTLLAVLAPAIAMDTSPDMDDALRRLARRRYDLVLLDWHLDGRSGDDTIAQLRAAGCAARIVVMSGDASPAVVRRAIELGAAGFLPKRCGSDQMLAALRTVLDGGVYVPPDTAPASRAPRRGASARDRLARTDAAPGADLPRRGARRAEQADRARARHRRVHRQDAPGRRLRHDGRAQPQRGRLAGRQRGPAA